MDIKELIVKLNNMQEYYAAGYFSSLNQNIYSRFSAAIINCLGNCDLPIYENTYLYPVNNNSFFAAKDKILSFNYAYPFAFNQNKLESSSLNDKEKEFIKNIASQVYKGGEVIEDKYALAGRGFTHFVPNYEYFLDNSLNDLKRKVEDYKHKYKNEFSKVSVDIVDSIIMVVERMISHLKSFSLTDRLQRILKGYEKFLNEKANNIYDALLRINFVFTLDGCDNIGKLDTYLSKYPIQEDTLNIVKEHYQSMEKVSGWNVVLTENNKHSYLCINAAEKETKPNLSITFKENEDNIELFKHSTNLLKENGSVAMYNYDAFVEELTKLGIPLQDAENFAFGGCSELMVAGKSNCGAIDAGINMIQTLNDVLEQTTEETSFDELLNKYKETIKKSSIFKWFKFKS